MIRLSVILPTHSPHPGRLARTLAGLAAQTLPRDEWELLLIDNASPAPIEIPAEFTALPLRIVPEPTLGLSHARRRGFREARGEFLILVDDDNVLVPAYLANTLAHFAAHPHLGAIGGPSRPEFERAPLAWQREFFPLLALRDLGPAPLHSPLRPPGAERDEYPACAPIGAGMALRRAAAHAWLNEADPSALPDRRGDQLTSGGDNDIVLHALRAGWEAGYFPDLALTHLIPASRLDPDYLARLNRGIRKSWVQLLIRHRLGDWTPIPRWSLPLRRAKAWFVHRAWQNPAARIRWQGACGHFEGLASPPSTPPARHAAS